MAHNRSNSGQLVVDRLVFGNFDLQCKLGPAESRSELISNDTKAKAVEVSTTILLGLFLPNYFIHTK